tara:strand:+ start:6300 stop:6821 length:522 start_codon:yes stop_codon:yes gene_type:complete
MSYSSKIKKFFRKKQDNHNIINSNISISKVSASPKTALVIFPFDENFFRVASYTYRNLPYDKKEINFHYLINSSFSDSFSLRRGAVHHLSINDKCEVVNIDEVLNSLNMFNFDIIIDLNISYDSKSEQFILKQDSNFKIGFMHEKSDSLYNVQLDISKSQIAENGYQKILELI